MKRLLTVWKDKIMELGKHNLYRQALLTLFYVLVALIPVLACLLISSQLTVYLMDREALNQAQSMQQGMAILSATLTSAENYTVSTFNLPKISPYLNAGRDGTSVFVAKMLQAKDSLPAFQDAGGLVDSFYLYSGANDTILSRSGGCTDLNLHYLPGYSVADFDFDTYRSRVLNGQKNRAFFPLKADAQGESLLFVCGSSRNSIRKSAVFYLNAQRLTAMLKNSMTAKNGQLALYDSEGQLLYTTAPLSESLYEAYGAPERYQVISLDGQETVLHCVQLPAWGLTLYSTLPKAYFSQAALSMVGQIFERLLPLILACLALLIVLLCTSHQSLRKAIQSVSGAGHGDTTINPFKYVQRSLSSLTELTAEQRQLLQKSREDLREAVLSTLLFERDAEGAGVTRMLEENGLAFQAAAYRVAALCLTEPESGAPCIISEQAHSRILEICEKERERFQYLKMATPQRMLFLFLEKETEDALETLTRSLSALCMEIGAETGLEARMFIGCECRDLMKIQMSFRSLKRLFTSSPTAEEYLTFAGESRNAPYFDYTKNDDGALRRLATAGDAEGVDELLADIYRRNSGIYARSPFETQLLYANMLHTLFQTGFSGKIDPTLQFSLGEVKIEQFFALLQSYYQAQCQESSRETHEKRKSLARQVVDMIESNYSDYDLSAGKAAVQLGISVRSISNLLREETGLGFAEYLEKVRLEQAAQLLNAPGVNINSIAARVGYTSADSFRRAFKRYTGQSPSQYREE